MSRLQQQINFFEGVKSPEHFQPKMEQYLQLADKNGVSALRTMDMRDTLAESYYNAGQFDKAKPHMERLVQDMSPLEDRLFDTQQERLQQLRDRLLEMNGAG